jgi:formamidopyrimidine-DNA glycosylase
LVMPELPDVELYLACLRKRIEGHELLGLQTITPFILKTVKPEPADFAGKTVTGLRRIGKRVVIEFEGDLFAVIHLMIAGRLRWIDSTARPPAKISHAVFWFDSGNLVLTEASSKKRAGIYLARGEKELKGHDPGGIEPLACDLKSFKSQLVAENRTLKRALTNPQRFSGIGNAYSDEILFHAQLSPVRLTGSLSEEEISRLHAAVKETLILWRDRLREEFKDKFPGPGDVTAFRPDFAVHGKFGRPCPVCGCKVQRIQYAENETNYCAQCQNEGRLLADRSLSRLLKDDWPRTLEQMEQ